MRPSCLALAGVLALNAAFGEGDWVECATPGKASEIGFGEAKKGIRSVLDLTSFDGKLYISLSPGKEAAKILCFDPEKEQLLEEHETECGHLGTFRVIGGKLYVPEAAPVPEDEEDKKRKKKEEKEPQEVGYYVSAGKGEWERVVVGKGPLTFHDIAHFDGKTFLVGSSGGKAIIAWRPDGEEEWRIIQLNSQAARWSACAKRFLVAPDLLSVLADRRPDPNPMARAAPQAWGAWYVLHYCPKLSERYFLFDGQPRPLPVLRVLAPGSNIDKVGRMLAHDTPFAGGLLFTVLAEGGTVRDDKGGLFHATIKEGNPQIGRTFMGRRIPDMDLARDAAVEGEKCYVLLADNPPEKQAKIVVTSDLEKWETIFSGELDATPISIGVVNGTCYIGLADGVLATVFRD